MEKGLAIMEKTDTETKCFYIDQDALECARLNAKIKKRVERMEAERREAAAKHRKAVKAKAREKAQRKAYTIDTIKHVAVRAFITAAVAAAVTADLASLYLFIPVFIICLSGACLRLGAWFVRGNKN